MIRAGLAFSFEPSFLAAALPLFEASEVKVLEWSFDTDWVNARKPDWAIDLLQQYSAAGALLGHGVSYSFASPDRAQYHSDWLELLKNELHQRRYVHITEHFGFCSGGDFHRCAPLPIPLTEDSLAVSINNIKKLQAISEPLPIGIENLAFAFSRTDLESQAEFVTRIVADTGCFVLCDLHNIYCQAANFSIDPRDILALYPAENVLEVHISGGSWVNTKVNDESRIIRRDTHDERVPEEVFELLEVALRTMPNISHAILEQLPESLCNDAAQEAFREDFRRLADIVEI